MPGPVVLIHGYGAFGRLHAEVWLGLGARVLIVEPSPPARDAAVAAGIPAGDVAADDAAFLARADLVDIVAPPAAHLALAQRALAAGKPVFLEKPAVCTLAEARALIAAQAAAGKVVQVNLLLRAHPMTARAAHFLAQGEIGALILMEGRFCGWKRRHLGISLQENDGVHFLDLMRHFSGAPVARFGARSLSLPGGEGSDDLSLDLIHANGVHARLALGLLAPGGAPDAYVSGAITDKTLRLIGDKGCLTLDYNRDTLTVEPVTFRRGDTTLDVIAGAVRIETFADVSPKALLARSFRAFLAECAGDAAPMVPLSQAVCDLTEVLDAIPRAVQIAHLAHIPMEGAPA
jgi:predicted dehydrogenase